MPGRTPAQARDSFLAPLKRSLSCVTRAQLFASRITQPGEEEALALSDDPLRLRSARLDGGIVQLELRHKFRIVKDDDAPASSRWHVSTTAYYYKLDDHSGRELVAWHWHPGTGADYPHLHASGGTLEKAMHLPTGRVSIESVLLLLLNELAVKPTREDYTEVLRESERRFIEHRRWHA